MFLLVNILKNLESFKENIHDGEIRMLKACIFIKSDLNHRDFLDNFQKFNVMFSTY